MNTPTEGRDLADRLAKLDTATALAVAEGIDAPWFKAQALACVGRWAEERRYKDIIQAAKRASWSAQEPYETVGSTAWWLRALIERGAPDEVVAEVPNILDASRRIANPVSRVDALYLVFQAVFEVDAARRAVLDALLAACASAKNSWRARRCESDVATMLYRPHPEEAARVIALMPEGNRKRQAIRRTTEASNLPTPRPFFW